MQFIDNKPLNLFGAGMNFNGGKWLAVLSAVIISTTSFAAELPSIMKITPTGEIKIGDSNLRWGYFDHEWNSTKFEQEFFTPAAGFPRRTAADFMLQGEWKLRTVPGKFKVDMSVVADSAGTIKYTSRLQANPAIPANMLTLILSLPMNGRDTDVMIDGKRFCIPGTIGKTILWPRAKIETVTIVLGGVDVTFSGKCLFYIQDDRAFGGTGASLRFLPTQWEKDITDTKLDLNISIKVPASMPLNLSAVANMGFKDEVANDGKGGWSDQGPENDMRSFDVLRNDYEGIPFKIIDPAKNGGKAIISFDHQNLRNGRKTAVIDFANEMPSATRLYLIHTSCYNAEPNGTAIGSITAVFDDGSSLSKEVKNGTDLMDWWAAGDISNAKVVARKSGGNANVGVFLSKFELSDTPRHVKSIELKSNGKALWIVAGATLSQRDISLAPSTLKFIANDEWKVIDMSDIQVKPGSALDLTGLLKPGHAGKHGRLIAAKSGNLAFEDSPDVPHNFRGYNSFWPIKKMGDIPKAQLHQEIAKYAELVRRGGYDLVRPLYIDNYLMGSDAKVDGQYNPDRLDNIDWLVASLKKNGIYTYVSIGAYRVGSADGRKGWLERDSIKMKMYLGDPETRNRWKDCAENLLNHVNPYTGKAWKDEPAIPVVEPYNEQETAFLKLGDLKGDALQLCEQKWGAWLKAKYGTLEKLIATANDSSIPANASFDAMKMPVRGNGFFANEFILFRQNIAEECFSWCNDVIRKTGYKGLVSQYNFDKKLMGSAVRWQDCEVVSMNGYFAHPTDTVNPGSQCVQNSSVGNVGGYWRDINATRFSDRPFINTEQKQCFWNKYRHEDGLLFAAYAAFQGFDGAMVHCDPVLMKVERNFDFVSAYDPVAMANEFISACLYKRGDVKRHEKSVELLIPASYLNSSCNGDKAISSTQTRIALMTGFSIAFADLKKLSSIPEITAKPDMVIGPDGGSEVKGTAWAATVAESKDAKFNLINFVASLKGNGVLPKSNISNPDKEIYQSDTGEITLRARENLIKVITARTEGISLESGKSEPLGCLKVINSTVPASVAVCAIDGKPVASSSKIVLIYATDAVNSGMELSSDRITLLKSGNLPILMQTGKLNVTLKSESLDGMKLFALGMDGSRKEILPLQVENGSLKIEIDTAKLKHGPTPFFEIARD